MRLFSISLLTNEPNYPANIKKTAEAVYMKSTGGAPLDIPSSPKNVFVPSSPPAEGASNQGISGVSKSDLSIAPLTKKYLLMRPLLKNWGLYVCLKKRLRH